MAFAFARWSILRVVRVWWRVPILQRYMFVVYGVDSDDGVALILAA
jgi:hypothetical protein